MNELKNSPWFPKKKYGVGWGLPSTWQGWIVLLTYILLSVIGPAIFSTLSFQLPLFLLYFAILTLLFIFVVWKKGEKNNE